MKKITIICLAGLLVLCSGCQKVGYGRGSIRFSATTPSISQTKAVWGEDVGDESSGIQRIVWKTNDEITLKSNLAKTAEGQDSYVYTVTNADPAQNGNPAYNFGVILNYLFRMDALERIARKELPLHVVEKKIPHIDADGQLVKPSEPNGCKFEQLVLDMIHEFSSCLPYEVVREREFAPIKNPTGVDSVESARELCTKNGIVL